MLELLMVLSVGFFGASGADESDSSKDSSEIVTLTGTIKSVEKVKPGEEDAKDDDGSKDEDSDEGKSDDESDAENGGLIDWDEEDDGEPREPHGIASFKVSAKGKTYTVQLHDRVTVTRHKAVPISALEKGQKLWVLGRYQDKQRIPGESHSLPPQIIQIQIVVASDQEFKPPALTPDQRDRKLAWHKGGLGIYRKSFRVGYTAMQIGNDARVLFISKLSGKEIGEAIKKKQKIAMEGVLEDTKTKSFTAVDVILPARRMPKKAYGHVYPPRS